MINLGSIVAQTVVDLSGLRQGLGQAEQQASQSAQRIDSALGRVSFGQFSGGASGATSALGGLVEGVGGAVTSFAALTGAIAAANLVLDGVKQLFSLAGQGIIGMNSTLEQSAIAWNVFLKNTDAAREKVQELFNFAKVTPFTFQDVDAAARQLLAFGGAALVSKENLTLFGNVAAGTGKPLQQITYEIGQMYSELMNGLPFGRAARALVMFGALSGETRVRLEEMRKAGASGAEMWKVFTDNLNRFSGNLEKQSTTWQGAFTTFKDNLQMAASVMFKPLFDAAKGALIEINNLFANPQFQQAVQTLQGYLQLVVDALKKVGQAFAAGGWDAGFAMLEQVVVNGLKAVAALFADFLVSLGRTLEANAPDALKPFVSGFVALGEGVQRAIRDWKPQIVAGTTDSFGALDQAVASSMHQTEQTVSESGGRINEALLRTFSKEDFSAFDQIMKALTGQLGNAKGASQDLKAAQGELRDVVVQAIADLERYGTVQQATWQQAAQLPQQVISAFNELLTAYTNVEGATKAVKDAQDALSGAQQHLKEVTREQAAIVKQYQDALKGAQDAAKAHARGYEDTLRGLRDEEQAATDAANQHAQEFARSIDRLRGLVTAAQDAAQANADRWATIIDGLKRELDAAQETARAHQDASRQLIDDLRAQADAARETAQAHQAASQQIIDALQAEVSAAQDAARARQEAAQAAIDALQAQLDAARQAAQEQQRAYDRQLADLQKLTDVATEAARRHAAAWQATIKGIDDQISAARERATRDSEQQRAAIAALQAQLKDQEAASRQHAETYQAILAGNIDYLSQERDSQDAITRAIRDKWEAEVSGRLKALTESDRDVTLKEREQRRAVLSIDEQIAAARAAHNDGEVAALTRQRTATEQTFGQQLQLLRERAAVRRDEYNATAEQVKADAAHQATLDKAAQEPTKIRIGLAEQESRARDAANKAAIAALEAQKRLLQDQAAQQAATDKAALDALAARKKAIEEQKKAAQDAAQEQQRAIEQQIKHAQAAMKAQAAADREHLAELQRQVKAAQDAAKHQAAADKAHQDAIAKQIKDEEARARTQARQDQGRIDAIKKEIKAHEDAAKEEAKRDQARVKAAQDAVKAEEAAAKQRADSDKAAIDAIKERTREVQRQKDLTARQDQDRIDAAQRRLDLARDEAATREQTARDEVTSAQDALKARQDALAVAKQEYDTTLARLNLLAKSVTGGQVPPPSVAPAPTPGRGPDQGPGGAPGAPQTPIALTPVPVTNRSALSGLLDLGQALSAAWDVVAGVFRRVGDLILTVLQPAFDDLSKSFTTADLTDLRLAWRQLQNAFDDIAKVVALVFLPTWALIGVAVIAARAVIEAFAMMLPGIIAVVTGFVQMTAGAFQFLGGLIDLVMGTIRGVITGNWDGVTAATEKMRAAVLLIVDGLTRATTGFFVALVLDVIGSVKGLWEGVVDFFTRLYRDLVGASIVPDLVNAVEDWFRRLRDNTIGLAGDLVSTVTRRFGELKDALWAKGQEIWENLVGRDGWFTSAGAAIVDKLKVAGDTAFTNFDGFKTNLWTKGNEIWSNLVGRDGWFTNVGAALVDKLKSAGDTAYTNFDTFRGNLWSKGQEIFNNLIGGGQTPGWFASIANSLVDKLRGAGESASTNFDTFRSNLWTKAKEIHDNLFDPTNGWFTQIGNKLPEPFRLLASSIGDIMKGVANNFIDALNGMLFPKVDEFINKVIDAINQISQWIKGSNLIPDHVRTPPIPRFAKGTANFAGGWAVVGEEGFELAHLPPGATIVPHQESVELLRTGAFGTAEDLPGFAGGLNWGPLKDIWNALKQGPEWVLNQGLAAVGVPNGLQAPALPGFWNDLASGVKDLIKNVAVGWIQGLLDSLKPKTPPPVNGYVFPVVGYSGTIEPHGGPEYIGGSDIFASLGTPLVVMRGGTATVTGEASGGPGGNNVYIRADDSLAYYYAHLRDFPLFGSGPVSAGQAMGYVGTTGNAVGTPPHLHIGIGPEISTGVGPPGGLGINPDGSFYDAVSLLRRVLAGSAPGGGGGGGSTNATVSAILGKTGSDTYTALAMLMGSFMEGGWDAPFPAGDFIGPGGAPVSFGPFQINTQAHPDVNRAQAEDPTFATNYMYPDYFAGSRQSTIRGEPVDWSGSPWRAGALVAYYAERPYAMYPDDRIAAAFNASKGYAGFANGGILTEPIVGVGASGIHYTFGEVGPELVLPLAFLDDLARAGGRFQPNALGVAGAREGAQGTGRTTIYDVDVQAREAPITAERLVQLLHTVEQVYS